MNVLLYTNFNTCTPHDTIHTFMHQMHICIHVCTHIHKIARSVQPDYIYIYIYIYIYVTLSHLRSKEIPVYIYDIALAVEC